jgi:hypothetical protein
MAGNCLIHSNSVSLASLSSVGNATVTATAISTTGGVSGTGFNPVPLTFSPSIADPYASVQLPTPGPCIAKVKLANQTQTLLPGTYCGGVSISGNSNITLQSNGVYIFKGGDLRVSGNSILSGSGVTLYFTTDGDKYAGFDISGDTTSINLIAPIDSDGNGIVIYQDRSAPLNSENSITGGNIILRGVVYTPSSALVLSGHADILNLRLVARELDMDGSSSLHN